MSEQPSVDRTEVPHGRSRPATMHGSYHKIPTVWKRSPETRKLIVGRPRTDEFEYLENLDWTFQEKIDGTNIRVHWDGHQAHFAGKTDRADLQGLKVLPALNALFGGERNAQLFEQTFGAEPVTLYGEAFGAGIQKGGGDYLPEKSFALFDVRSGATWFTQPAVQWVAEQLGVFYAPVVGHGSLLDATEFAKEGFGSKWGTKRAEGIVVRPEVEMLSRRGHRVIGKLKTVDFT